jgi:hypothetical protein
MKLLILLFCILLISKTFALKGYEDESEEDLSQDDAKIKGVNWAERPKYPYNGATLYPAWASAYFDSSDITPFTEFVTSGPEHVHELDKNNNTCEAGFKIINLPLGPVCIKEIDFTTPCNPSCPEGILCWRGVCVDPHTNMCASTNPETNEINYIACNKNRQKRVLPKSKVKVD